MTSLSRLAQSYKNKKIQATKLRRQTENKLKTAVSLKRSSSSGLSSLERRKDTMNAKKDGVSQLLTQYLAQRASIQRLKTAAEERIMQEKEARERAQQESEFSESPDD
ncbi:MAG: ATPase V, partial [Nitrosopumilaceae archaeon]